ncbi:hypothetical protein CXG81DRAFT_12734 [Caulochytrium protostelioides]|uniref:non-specific serine/threonine protein kinase n=1 Tax=Caulochytrium protostelioides TaxID=1555241 RepID=A0A4P9X6P9_9FUNG|nr:hypothetical protein CXG81DRAFT_12734 [Caulochytrium protostelioides]|eukprot:RKP00842.1 hypothetical protein CXG81DRAFT_12734 [Caulochytrium protostelioides]
MAPAEARLIKQGAEARVYRLPFGPSFAPMLPLPAPTAAAPPAPPATVIAKERLPKAYRHASLDERLTRRRMVQEARALQRVQRASLAAKATGLVPAPNPVSESEAVAAAAAARDEAQTTAAQLSPLLRRAADALGMALALMHDADVIHGDLTTSNMMLRHGHLWAPTTDSTVSPTATPPAAAASAASREDAAATASDGPDGPDGGVVLIDFGLSWMSHLLEDKAVDLNVLYRTFTSTHPEALGVFWRALDTYVGQARQGPYIRRRFETVRLRGRKRVAFG